MADPTFDDYLRRLFHIESGGNPNAVTGSNRGLGQFGPAEERMFGLNDSNRTDPKAQAAAVAREYAQNHPILTKALGREPTYAEHYLMHQQGVAGAPALLANPDAPAWKTLRPFYKSDAVAKSAVMGNIPSDNPLKSLPVDQISGAGFTQMWLDKFNRGMPGGGGTGAPPETVAANTPMPATGEFSPMSDLLAKLGLGSPRPLGAAQTGAGPVAMATGLAPPPAQAGPMPDGSTIPSAAAPNAAVLAGAQKALDADKETAGEKNSKAMMALAQQLMAGSQAKPVQFMQLQPGSTAPVRPLPLDLPKFPGA